MNDMRFLEEQGVNRALIEAVLEYRTKYTVDESTAHRVVRPQIPFFGKEVLNKIYKDL